MSELITISPIDGQELLRRPHATAADLERITLAARRAQRDWAQQPLSARVALLEKAIDQVVARTETFALSITEQMGRPISQSPGELRGFAERGRYMLSIAEEALAPLGLPVRDNLHRSIEREPVGVVLTIAPWNYPLLTAVNSIVPALAAGNAVILKHSDQTPLCAEQMVQAFADAGLPAGLFQYVHATHDTIRALIQSPAVDYVAFTGSVRGGAAVEEAATGRFIGRGLELGGNDPAYVREDADLDQAVETLVDGAFFNSGQSCCGIQRIYVHQSHYRTFVDRAVALAEQYRLGNPLDPNINLGPVVRLKAAEEIRATLARSIGMGARDCVDPGRFPMALPGSTYLAPSILTQVSHEMPVMNEECFGPVVGIMPVASDEQAVALMNDCRYGLTAAIFTRDMDAARHLGQQLETGTVFMNRCDYLDPALAWTGVKHTGHGISLSIYGYHMLTRVKSYHLRAL
ncbi:aldehyde dehydrogenase family protein [Castellaniella sp.]|uniref:aldehyde dehydrogenase family protein n=1 Tax=Castellaniella sp. TaxID=1955812 RepID=UPI002D7F0087|nr:aldehyde dehydrogenase family protein [Castellaniella sp.]HET8704525.1 aldehyde dehydrogenase family protein [Castellaniella sp.]